MARLSRRDARAWHDLAGRVAAVIESRLAPEVVANRARTTGRRWRIESLKESFRRLRGMARPLKHAATGGAVFVTTDVRDFFPSVGPDALARALLAAGVSLEDAASAAAMLEGWADHGYRGLPVGPPGSAVLANAVLMPVDAGVRRAFVRWVDDYLLAAPTEREAVGVLDRLDGALAGLGLGRSAQKTRIREDGGWLQAAAVWSFGSVHRPTT
jgi:reverse transcriptase-like protein